MNNSNGNDGPIGPQPTPDEWVPTEEQPWRLVPDDDTGGPYRYDYGTHWCADRASHPQFQDDGYPSLNHHRTECRSYDGWFGALSGEGAPGCFSVYLVRPFRFGQLGHAVDETRLAIEFDPAEDDAGPLVRFTVPASIIRNIAAHLTQTADTGDGWRSPRRADPVLFE